MPAMLPLKESSRDLIVEVLHALEPYFPDLNAKWRHQLEAEFRFDGTVLAKLERVTIATACAYFCHGDFPGFFENLHYFGTRLAKLKVDTRHVARALEIYRNLTEPYLAALFGERLAEAAAALEMVSSATFVTVSGAYFDAKTEESRALLTMLDAELQAESLDALLAKVLETSAETFDASFGVILLRDENEDDLLRVSAGFGCDQEFCEGYRMRVGDGFAGMIAQTGEMALSLDATNDSRIVYLRVREKAKSLWGVPLKTKSHTIGVMVLGFSKPYEWLPTERELLRAVADRSALAIERARMTEALRDREARIAELSAHLLQAQEEERKRISRELHDETGQSLMVIRLYLGMLESTLAARVAKNKVRETVEVVDRTIDGIRRIIARLSPLVLQELGLEAAIRKEAKDLAKTTGVRAKVAISREVGRLESDVEAAIYRVVQEALHNVAKHAQAKMVTIKMDRDDEFVNVYVEDDGVGMNPKAGFRAHSFGLAGMRERVGMLHGDVNVTSARGKGTRIQVRVPAPVVAGKAAVANSAASVISFASHSSGQGSNLDGVEEPVPDYTVHQGELHAKN